ncbi:zinc finger BED domain-containing protein RICESLEEPER 1-like [Tasmannia lanceolata]|uniref:zinc finger BED domain-containing protein RICESLEEPER 1-like n=1 Tax=Tasmannia lanceolata TaxID=3420 RepID=UPI0040644248
MKTLDLLFCKTHPFPVSTFCCASIGPPAPTSVRPSDRRGEDEKEEEEEEEEGNAGGLCIVVPRYIVVLWNILYMSSMGDTYNPNAEVGGGSNPTEEVSSQSTKVCPTKKKAIISEVWVHFTKVLNMEEGKPEKAICNYCKSAYTYSSSYGTSTLWKHFRNCPKYPNFQDKRQKLLSSYQSVSQEGGDSSLVAWKFDQELCREALTRMIIIDELPFRFVEREGFRYFCSVMQPRFKLVGRRTVARDCLALYASEKKKMKDFLHKTNQRVSLTTDAWTSLQNLSYMCLTAHFIDHDWKLHKRIINFCIISSHKGEAIGQAVESCMIQWGIENVCTITVDNASSNDTAVGYLKKKISNRNGFILDGEFFHMRCCAHILNLIVKDGINEVIESISRIRGAVRYIRSSPSRLGRFKSCVEKERITCKSSLCLDVPTRWNSTYLMLETALKFRKAFERLEDEDVLFVTELKDGSPTFEDWDNARVLTHFLKTFYDATLRLSGSLHVTSNSYFHEVFKIERQLYELLKSEDVFLSNMAFKMKEKFDKYWGNIDKVNMMLLLAVVLDPRFKLKYVKFCYSKLYTSDKVSALTNRVGGALHRLFVHYKSISSPPTTSTVQNVNDMEVVESEIVDSEFVAFLKEEESEDSKSEVDRYLEEGCETQDPKFEILNWWKVNSSRYKILSQIARDVLAIPVSTVASESAFSTGGRILDQFRSSLTPKLVECLICGQDWLRASPLPIEIEEQLDELEEFELVDSTEVSLD